MTWSPSLPANLQVYGVYWLLVATAAYRLSQAAENDNLSSSTYQRLNALLALFTIGSALPLLQVRSREEDGFCMHATG